MSSLDRKPNESYEEWWARRWEDPEYCAYIDNAYDAFVKSQLYGAAIFFGLILPIALVCIWFIP